MRPDPSRSLRPAIAALAALAALLAPAPALLAPAPALLAPAPALLAPAPALLAPAPALAAHVPASHAPSVPPLVGSGMRAQRVSPDSVGGGSSSAPGVGLGEGAVTGSDASASAPPSSGDPLVENGLGSPLCGAPAELPAASRRNCETSGFEAAGAPTGDYGLDVHIDTGLLGLTSQTLLQDYLIEPVWMGLVWVVHALIVALEWCFALDLLDSSVLGDFERSLRATRTTLTGPWLVAALALASIAAAYNGLVRRRVAETLGQSALMLAMMAGGLWVIADPAGTVGALGRWVDEASAGTLGAVVQGSPAHASRTLAQSMSGLFGAAVGAPWCYLEFGNVNWCEAPTRLEPRLRAAGLALLTRPRIAKCEGHERVEPYCEALESEAPRASTRGRSRGATLMRAARTNGEVFLALPANEAARNSIDEPDSLLRVLCGGSESATECRGPAAAEAEFRTQGGTTPRLAGLLLIAIGAVGMIRLLGFIVLHLLGAELLSLLYLLLAPAAVLAPALGDGGRAAFRTWATRLVGAVCSKLVFSFLLGVVLLMTRTLIGLEALGWWTRWLLVAVLWWGAHRQRHQVLGFISGEHRARERHRSLLQRFKQQLEGPRTVLKGANWMRKKLAGPAPSVERQRTRERLGRERAQATADEQVSRMLEHEHVAAGAHSLPGSEAQRELSAKRAQLQRIRGREAQAVAAGDTRHAARLGHRARRVEDELERGQLALNEARHTAAEGERAQSRTGRPYTAEQLQERSAWLDAQAALPPARAGGRARGGSGSGAQSGTADGIGGGVQGGDTAGGGARRDYAALAGLAGYGREQYEQLHPRAQREARLEIDRELALRHELRGAAGAVADSYPPTLRAPGRRERRRAERDFEDALEQRLHESGHAAPRSRDRPPRRERPRDVPSHRSPRADPPRRPGGGFESPVLRDAHEVARRRKRQLGS